MGRVFARVAGVALAFAIAMPVSGAAAGEAAAQRPARAAAIAGGHDQGGAWLVAEYRDFQLRKRGDRATKTIAIELRVAADVVAITAGPQGVTVTRGDRRIVVDSAEALQSVQELLGSSPAVFGARGMLSELEAVSTLNVPEMSLLSAAAFVASLVGDTEATQRVADRFVEKHRGLYRQVRLPSSSGCWATYSAEVTASWNELQDCMADADDKEFFRAAYERIACNTIWLLRSESAYFEYLNCLSPLSAITK